MINTHGYGYLTWTRIQGDERNPPISRHIDTTVDVTFNCVCVYNLYKYMQWLLFTNGGKFQPYKYNN